MTATMVQTRRLVVVGNGMAGARTVEEILERAGAEQFSITMFGDEPYGNYNRIMLSHVLSGQESDKDIFLNTINWYQDNGITLHAGTRVTRIDRFAKLVHALDPSGERSVTPYDVLIIASMVEKETLAPSERPLVAAVIYNRLHARMPLGIDATLRYGLHIPPTQSILESQLASDNPYNSRRLTGLPPTPIANPGIPSIRAAAHPAAVDYLYFVRKPDKVHHFFTASDTAFAQYECAHGYGC